MIIRIILSIVLLRGVLIFIGIVRPIWKLMTNADSIIKLFEEVFNVYPEELYKILMNSRKIRCAKIQFEYSNVKEACLEFGKFICETLCYYEEYDVIVKQIPELQERKERLLQIKQRVYWLGKRA